MTTPVLALLAAGWSIGAPPAGLPVTPAESLSGRKLDFPSALAGKPTVCVFSFSREAGEAVGVWMNRLTRDGVDSWSVANLEGAPSLLRGMIRGSMRKGLTQPLLERSLVLTKNEKAWRAALGIRQEKLPAVVLLDAAGRLLWRHEGLFGDEMYRELKSRLEAATARQFEGGAH